MAKARSETVMKYIRLLTLVKRARAFLLQMGIDEEQGCFTTALLRNESERKRFREIFNPLADALRLDTDEHTNNVDARIRFVILTCVIRMWKFSPTYASLEYEYGRTWQVYEEMLYNQTKDPNFIDLSLLPQLVSGLNEILDQERPADMMARFTLYKMAI